MLFTTLLPLFTFSFAQSSTESSTSTVSVDSSSVSPAPSNTTIVPVVNSTISTVNITSDPFDTTNTTFCWKQTQLRSVRFSTNGICQLGWEKQIGLPLCYPKCKPYHNGAGPICWGQCQGNYPEPCGLGCAKSSVHCQKSIFSQVTSIAEVAFNIGVAAHLAVGIPSVISKLTIGEYATEAGERVVKEAIEHVLIRKLGPAIAAKIAETLAADAFSDNAGSVNWTKMDPTGVTALVEAFYRPICGAVGRVEIDTTLVVSQMVAKDAERFADIDDPLFNVFSDF